MQAVVFMVLALFGLIFVMISAILVYGKLASFHGLMAFRSSQLASHMRSLE